MSLRVSRARSCRPRGELLVPITGVALPMNFDSSAWSDIGLLTVPVAWAIGTS